ncbi:hypothetical protein EDD66_102293 [Mobilisporobacter senegalensis]|uniref:Type IV pilus assembly protein PilO n=1 Tax=Mobilisporobacter senegalensis TaxID=1329262 RepID=A0A3N1XVJ8_9FIRM|nr:hypothetical protein [Mobilisporobacter senegalensis]ROR30639.1 hypothetical protein EDD66_102293 [Mobilisporobacter senegalensis]
MEFINKLSQKEKNLIFILFILVILLVSYRFGFVYLTNKTDALHSENIELSTKLADLQQKVANKDKYAEETNQMTGEITHMLNNLSTSISQEKSTVFVTELEENAKMNVSAVTYGEVSEVYSQGQAAAGQEEASDGDVTATDPEITNETVPVESTGEQVGKQSELKGYKSNITINYQTNYAGLKSAIDYINKYKEKMRIQSLTAAFDSTTGNLTGTLSYDVFALLGEGREEESVYINGVNIGKDNIFGTFELPVE